MIEDDMYRSSSQYRYWSYTQQNLDELRQTTNNLAADRVKAAFQRARSSTAANGESSTDKASEQPTIDTLTVEEELKIVRWGCSKIVEMGEAMTPKIPMSIVVGFSLPYVPSTRFRLRLPFTHVLQVLASSSLTLLHRQQQSNTCDAST